MGDSTNRALTAPELAERWNVTPQALAQWRARNDGPPFLKLGKSVRYRMADVVAHEEAHLSRGGR